MRKIELCLLLILLLCSTMSSGELQDTITPDTTAVDTVSIPNVNPSTKTDKSHVSIGYNLGVCYRGEENTYTVNYGDFSLDPFELLAATIYALHSIEFESKYVINKKMIETGVDFSFARVTSSYDGQYPPDNDTILLRDMNVYQSIFSFTYIYKISPYIGIEIGENLIFGAEFNYGLTKGYETYLAFDAKSFELYNIKRHFLGGGIYLKIANTDKSLNKIWFSPYALIKFSGAEEVYSSSEYEWNEKLTHWYAGCYIGFNLF